HRGVSGKPPRPPPSERQGQSSCWPGSRFATLSSSIGSISTSRPVCPCSRGRPGPANPPCPLPSPFPRAGRWPPRPSRRARGAPVRKGDEQGQVTAAFELPSDHPVRVLMAENDIPAEDELILRRVQFADGRTRAFVNDQPLSAQALKALGTALVEIHGQHDERALVDTSAHRRLLEAFGALDGKAAEGERLWNQRRARAGAGAS